MLSVLNSLSTKQKKYTEIVTCCHGPFFVVVVVPPPIIHFHVKWKVTFHSSYTGMTIDLDDPILKLPVSLTISIEKKKCRQKLHNTIHIFY